MPRTELEAKRARPCALCEDQDESFGVVRVWTWPAYRLHCEHFHPGMDARTLFDFPLPNKRARG